MSPHLEYRSANQRRQRSRKKARERKGRNNLSTCPTPLGPLFLIYSPYFVLWCPKYKIIPVIWEEYPHDRLAGGRKENRNGAAGVVSGIGSCMGPPLALALALSGIGIGIGIGIGFGIGIGICCTSLHVVYVSLLRLRSLRLSTSFTLALPSSPCGLAFLFGLFL